jgi:hypothetical protein
LLLLTSERSINSTGFIVGCKRLAALPLAVALLRVR